MPPSKPPPPVRKEPKPLSIKDRYQQNEKLINEEFKIWKKTSPMLYDLVYTYTTAFPSLTLQWTKDYRLTSDKKSVTAGLLLGTHTPNSNDKNYLRLYSVTLPSTLSPEIESPVGIPNFEDHGNQFKVEKEWEHPGEINKVRINQGNGLIATQTNHGDILIFDSKDSSSNTFKKTLKYHTKEGFGLEWNPIYSKNQLLSSSEDSKIALWDLDLDKDSKISKPVRTFETHSSIVNDVSWNLKANDLFASVGDDKSLQIHDLRSPTTNYKPVIQIDDAHEGSINAVDFHSDLSYLLATASSDKLIRTWDLRNLSAPLRTLYGHSSSVFNLKFKENFLLSGSIDRKVLVWDLAKISQGDFDMKEFEKKKNSYIDPCLVFMHGGHTGRISECDWHPVLDHVIASCAEDGLLEVWKPRHILDVYHEEDHHDEDEEMKL